MSFSLLNEEEPFGLSGNDNKGKNTDKIPTGLIK
jgi:hypothetical protein